MHESRYQGDYFAILVDRSGTEFVRTGNEALVVPLTDRGEVIFTIEPSAAFGELTLIVPGGETDHDESQIETANREL